jgi:hypothetical protein
MPRGESKEQSAAHKQALSETWNEIQALENETMNLLKDVRDGSGTKKDPKKKGMKAGIAGAKELIAGGTTSKRSRDRDDGTSSKGGKKSGTLKGGKKSMKASGGGGSSTTMADPNAKTVTNLTLDLATATAMDKTRQLYEDSIGRVTVEVLDDASPDVTPRGEEETKLFDERMEAVKENQEQGARLRQAETIYRNSDFASEKDRILSNSDVFVSAPGVSAEDVKMERERLVRLEAAAKRKMKKQTAEVSGRSTYLAQDRSAIMMQKLYRGHIGRRKFRLSFRLKEIEKKSGANELMWIEVRDKESGDVWYYNKSTGQSQWDKPDDMFSMLIPKENVKSMSAAEQDDGGFQESKQQNFSVSGGMPSNQAVVKAKAAELSYEEKKQLQKEETRFETAARDEVAKDMGVDKFVAKAAMTNPDGSFKTVLRKTVMDALLETRFDSVSTVMNDQRWTKSNDDPFKRPPGVSGGANSTVDKSKQSMVSVMKFGKKDTSRTIKVDDEGNKELKSTDLTISDMKHPGFNVKDGQEEEEGGGSPGPFVPGVMCFGCWSAGAKRKCSLHDTGDMLKPSQTMLLCRNWELGVLRRRYRSEEIQEIFMKKGSSLRYDVKRKAFLSVVEQRHQIYRSLNNLTELFNFRMLLWMKIKRWLNSLADEVRSKPVSKQSKERVALMRMRRTLTHAFQLTNLLNELVSKLPVPPVTGTTWPERIGEIQFLFKRADPASGQEVELILAYPTPPNKTLYKPREYHLPAPRSIPMPKPAYIDENVKDVHADPEIIPIDSPATWLEKMVRSTSAQCVFDALDQVETITPISGLGLLKRTKQPPPATIKFASMGKKPVPNMLAVGGLPSEMLVYSIISTYIPPQFGNLLVMDKSTVSPGVSPEIMIQFLSVLMAPVNQKYLLRPLEHPLNYRRAPTITANSAIDRDNKDYYGTNRPEQTGEQESHGFRTSAWAKYVTVAEKVDSNVFVPGPEVASLNVPASNVSVTTHADHTYPFCEPSTRDNSTLDFFHLLLEGSISGSQAQVFTALTVQEPGLFMKECNSDLPMGHLVVSVYRSWAFTQKDTIEEYKTDDNISYWYHRRTGQTFWERPMYPEEEPKVLEGGTVLDMEHPEEPLTVHVGQEGGERRYTQGEFRKLMLSHHENTDEAEKRRKTAHLAGRVARDRGVFPEVPPGVDPDVFRAGESTLGHPGGEGSNMTVGQDPDNMDAQFPNRDNSSMVAHQVSQGSTVQFQPENGGNGGMKQVGPRTGADGGMFQGSEREPGANPTTLDHNGQVIAGGGAGNRLGSALDEGSMTSVPGSPTRAGTAGSQGGASSSQVLIPGMPAGQASAGMDNDMVSNLTNAMAAMMGQFNTLGSSQNPQDMLQLGMGMGMALLSTGAVQSATTMEKYKDQTKGGTRKKVGGRFGATGSMEEGGSEGESGSFPALSEEDLEDIEANRPHEDRSRDNISTNVRTGAPPGPLPIGKANPTERFSVEKVMDPYEETTQKQNMRKLMDDPLTALEHARGLKVQNEPTPTPDVAPEKVLTIEKPKNAEEGLKEEGKTPVMIYPELSSMVYERTDGNPGPPAPIVTHDPAGLGTSFVRESEGAIQEKVAGSDGVLRKTVVPLPVGFFNAIVAKHIAKQEVDYLPLVPNLPQARTVGRVKPRSAAIDWLAISFDPWSAGKSPLNSEFVPSLAARAEKILGGDPAAAHDALDRLRDSTSDAFMTTEDKEGQAETRKVITKEQLLAADFERVCSLCRHGKFAEVEALVNQPDWNVPVDYQNDMGNTLLHVVAQNGNKRLVKLSLRRGADLNVANLTGQTALHFAFGYGYDEVGEYLVKKGADDSIRNADGLTCYEGLGGHELNLL